MKKAIIAGFTLLIIGNLSNGCKNSNKLEFSEIVQTKTSIKQSDIAPIGSIFEWVKTKISPDTQLEILGILGQKCLPINTISSAKDKIPTHIYKKFQSLPPYFSIDGAFLKENVSEKRWQQIGQLLDTLAVLYTTLVSKDNPGLLYITPESETMSQSNKFLYANTITLSKFSPNIELKFSYSYTCQNNAVSELETNFYTICTEKDRNVKFQGAIDADIKTGNIIIGAFSGTLSSYKEGDKLVNNENISRHFIILL